MEDVDGLRDYEIVAEEIRQKKIWLVTGEEADKLRKLRRAEAKQAKIQAPNEAAPQPEA